MRCDDIAAFLYPYLDGEFGDREQAEFEAHLEHCPECSARVQRERWFLDTVRQEAEKLPRAPERLRRSVHAHLLQLEEEQTEPLWRRWFPERLPGYVWKPLPLIAGLGALTFMLWPIMGSSLDPVVDEMVANHEQQETAVDVAGPDPRRIQRFYQKRLPFPVKVPRFSGLDSYVLGGRLVPYRGHSAARVVYDVDGLRVTLTAYEDATLWEDDAPFPARRWVVKQADGYNVALFRSEGVTYGVTSKMKRPLLERMVRHASFTPSPR